jgi:hypothetical protein
MDTSKLIYSKSKEHILKGNKFWIHHIDFLKKISNINVFTFITVSLEKISFNVLSQSNPNNLLFRYVFELNSYSENSFKTFVTLIKKIVSGLEFNKLTGVFATKISKSPKPLFFDEFGLDYIDKNTCILCNDQTISKLKCNHFCCIGCFDNNLISKECTSCKKISKCTNNQFQYYSIEIDEFKSIKSWISSNKFFPNFIFNLNNNSYSSNTNKHNDWDNQSDYSGEEEDDYSGEGEGEDDYSGEGEEDDYSGEEDE